MQDGCTTYVAIRRPDLGSLVVGGLVFLCLSMATSIGLIVRARLPHHHLNAESKDVIRLATAVVGTLSALALGLLIASAKSTYDNAEVEMRTAAARVLLLDRVMSRDPVVVGEDTSLGQVSALMQKHRIKRIPVMRDGVPIGIISRADLLKAIVAADRDETAPGDEAIRRSIAIRLSENTSLLGKDMSAGRSAGIVPRTRARRSRGRNTVLASSS